MMPHVDGDADTTNYGVKGENANPAPTPPFFLFTGNSVPQTGVWGDAPNLTGVTGTSSTGVGVWGGSQSSTSRQGIAVFVNYGRYGSLGGTDPMFGQDAGVAGTSAQQGVFGNSTGKTGTGVYGNGFYAVRGESPNGKGFIGGVDPNFKQKAGVFGTSDQQGVIGASTGGFGTAVYGDSTSGYAIRGETTTGTAIQGTASNGGFAAQFSGNVAVANGDLTVAGDIQVTGDLILVNSLTSGDIAEDFDVSDQPGALEPGTVLVINEDGRLGACEAPYDTRVAGVVSGAGTLKPAVVLQRVSSPTPRSPIALVGKVYCKVDCRFGRIAAGDLLTTSPTLGHAMKVTDRSKALGALIGKALAGLDEGTGLIPIMASLR
jgi:hypothetical protein